MWRVDGCFTHSCVLFIEFIDLMCQSFLSGCAIFFPFLPTPPSPFFNFSTIATGLIIVDFVLFLPVGFYSQINWSLGLDRIFKRPFHRIYAGITLTGNH